MLNEFFFELLGRWPPPAAYLPKIDGLIRDNLREPQVWHRTGIVSRRPPFPEARLAREGFESCIFLG